jgi:hypothetical protein
MAENQKQMDRENLDAVEAGEERLRDEQIEKDRMEKRPESSQESPVPTHTNREEEDTALFEQNEAEKFRTHWLEIQSRFVDDPSVAVADANNLVADVISNITRTFSDERMGLENQWKRGDKVSTEDLRVALQRYRSFFNRLLQL